MATHLAHDFARYEDLADDRENLILNYYPLVRTIACRMARRLPPSVDVDELINVGVLGLIDAIDRFEPERGVPFKSYAEIRIQGSMFDSLRSDDWVPRSVRRKYNRIEDAKTSLTNQLGRSPGREEIADQLGTTMSEYEAMVKDARITRLISLDVATTEDGHTPLVESIPRNEDSIEHVLCMNEIKGEVAHAVTCLPEKERIAVTLYYMEGMTLRQIGAVLGVTESRACQLRGQGINRLKYRLRDNT
jgi:RNA polymerase sigma factor for flagellar operon FliA